MNAAESEELKKIRERREAALEGRITRRLKDLSPEALDRISAAIENEKGIAKRIKKG